MRNHRFYDKQDGEWMVYCIKTTGSFCTSIWNKGKYTRQTCPCCGQYITKIKKYSNKFQ